MSREDLPGSLDDGENSDTAPLELEGAEVGPVRRVSSERSKSDVGYKPSSRTTEETLAQGLSNEDLWMLIRRFNKQIYNVKAAESPREDIDLNRADDEQFPPEKLRMTLERFYTSVVVGVMDFINHVARLRSWKETRRTTVFCAVYFVAWIADLLIPLITGMLVALIVFPPLRPVLFPPVPTAQVDPGTGGVKKPSEAKSHDSITGAPEQHKGEAAEQEANNLVNSIANVAMESARGKYGQGIVEEEVPDSPEPMPMITAGETPTEETPGEDKTKQPMKKKVSKATDQTMRVISDITDIYERFANVLSPTPPFFVIAPRLRLVGILLSISVASLLTPSYMIVKGSGFAIGLGFFGDPIFKQTIDFLNTKVPNWKDQLDMQKTLLKGVPTNAQLTLTLLRIGEINSAPLPPPPGTQDNEPAWPIPKKKPKLAIEPGSTNTSTTDLTTTPPTLKSTNSTDSLSKPKSKKKWLTKVLRFVRRTIATAIKGHVAFDRAMAIAGSVHTKNLVTMLQQKGWISAPHGPLKFDAKFERKRGTVVIDSSMEPPVLYFTTVQSSKLDDLTLENQKKGSVLFQIPVTEIRGLKKTEGLGWKGKLIVELSVGSKDSADGLVISGLEEVSYHLTGMKGRNQLFNRLVAIDAQFWESW